MMCLPSHCSVPRNHVFHSDKKRQVMKHISIAGQSVEAQKMYLMCVAMVPWVIFVRCIITLTWAFITSMLYLQILRITHTQYTLTETIDYRITKSLKLMHYGGVLLMSDCSADSKLTLFDPLLNYNGCNFNCN